MSKGRIVEIAAPIVKSKYGIVVEEDENVVLLKVSRDPLLGNKLILGKKLIKERR